MRNRSLLIPAMAAVVLFPSFAWAQKGVVYEPSTQWAVTKVDEKTGQGSAYCALARRFERNMVLTIAKNSNEETSFALDFQAPRLSTAGTVRVVLDPGAGEQRSFDVYPVSNKAFVVRLGRDDPFFEALQRTGFLRMEMGSQSMAFNLSDIDGGQKKLNACITETTMPSLAEDPNIPSMAQSDTVMQELSSLRRDIQSLREENARLGSTPGTGAPAPMAAAAMQDMSMRLQALAKENDELRLQLAEVRTQDAAQPNTRGDSKMMGPPTQMPGVDTATVEQLRQRVAALAAENEAKDKKLVELGALSTEVQQLREKNSALSQQLAAAGGGTAPVNEDLAFLQSENERLKQALSAAQSGNVSPELLNLRNSVERLRGENKELQQKLAALTKQPLAEKEESTGPAEKLGPAMDLEATSSAGDGGVADISPMAGDEIATMKMDDIEALLAMPATPMAAPMEPVPVEAVRAETAQEPDYAEEARRQEEALRQQVARQSAATVSQSQDPFAAIETPNTFQGYAAAEGESQVQEMTAAAAPVALQPTAMSASAPPVQTLPQFVQPAAGNGNSRYQPSFDIAQILDSARIVPGAAVDKVEDASNFRTAAYQWRTSHVFGSAELEPLSDASQFDERVKSYLQKTQSRCAGDFAISPDKTTQIGTTRLDSYEIACVGEGVGSTASLLFFNKDGTFAVMAHEAPVTDMTSAIEITDRLMQVIGGLNS